MKMLKIIILSLSFLPLIASEKPSNLDKELLVECQKKDYEITVIKTYLEKKANPNVNIATTLLLQLFGEHETPLHAIMKNHKHALRIDTLKLLLYHNADPTIKDSSGYTPLHIMTQNASLKATVTLLKGAFEMPTSVPEICKKYNTCKQIAYCYMGCLKRKKIIISKPVNFIILYQALRPEENDTIKNILRFIRTRKDKAKGLFSSDDVILENATEMLEEKFNLTIQSSELLPTLGFLTTLSVYAQSKSYNDVMQFINKHDK